MTPTPTGAAGDAHGPAPRLIAVDMEAVLVRRAGEVRLGETFSRWRPSGKAMTGDRAAAGPRFALIGVPEDIGVRANGGQAGASALWAACLQRLANLPENHLLSGSAFAVAGTVDCADLMQLSQADISAPQLRELVSQLDDRVTAAVGSVLRAGLIPIVIGGGHNNALGVIKALSAHSQMPLGCLNVDAHADLRDLEGRHSGNAFTAALGEGLISRYSVLGLHEGAANSAICARLAHADCRAFSLESILRGEITLGEGIEGAVHHACGASAASSARMALEVDLDCVEGLPASATAASGFSGSQLRQIVMEVCSMVAPSSFHICEGIPSESGNGATVGRLAAELVCDFARGVLARAPSTAGSCSTKGAGGCGNCGCPGG